jgi:hypothetical protein
MLVRSQGKDVMGKFEVFQQMGPSIFGYLESGLKINLGNYQTEKEARLVFEKLGAAMAIKQLSFSMPKTFNEPPATIDMVI